MKEEVSLDVYYTNLVVGLFQASFGLLSIPTVALPFTPDAVPLDQLGTYMHDAAQCTVGINPEPEVTTCSDDALPALALFCIYLGEADSICPVQVCCCFCVCRCVFVIPFARLLSTLSFFLPASPSRQHCVLYADAVHLPSGVFHPLQRGVRSAPPPRLPAAALTHDSRRRGAGPHAIRWGGSRPGCSGDPAVRARRRDCGPREGATIPPTACGEGGGGGRGGGWKRLPFRVFGVCVLCAAAVKGQRRGQGCICSSSAVGGD